MMPSSEYRGTAMGFTAPLASPANASDPAYSAAILADESGGLVASCCTIQLESWLRITYIQ